jgi:hypothetical protein
MSQQSKKLVLSKETLRQLDDQDLSGVSEVPSRP